MNEKLLISQDLSCLGQVSLSVALPILGACGYQPDILPTAILSTHTGGFGDNTFLNLDSEMSKIVTHWQEQNIYFENLYLGYLGKGAIDFWLQHISDFKDSKVLFDPAMADSGKLYRGLDADYVTKMRMLANFATILTPNLTEVCLLLDKKYRNFSINEIKELSLELKKKFNLNEALITGISMQDKIKIVGVSSSDKTFVIENDRVERSFFGTGDMFASSLLAAILAGYSLKDSSQIAATFVKMAIKATDLTQDKRLGPNYAGALSWLMKKVEEKKVRKCEQKKTH
ncbi:pyridoxal kinase [Lactobacillus johnsonii]|uniref:pyridoxal kinase n=1 Tax=Lactobacillus johnsonii TaxID=33959 RepID=A0A1Z1N756_LACJH|nr:MULTISPECIES: PfkB family carbohydrate kinase [Lactobacillus]ARW75227.1 pyridoxal kinase [Lactobacillus johnsonii]ARW76814.1 pyridoxal kinase [Lactobacillus johnsonii]MCL5443985.1 PfkB family carbohydrate kinase [Lactobacillus johnsonii]PAB45013.1 pyridoxal kinase [Lactobacillus johnsonii]PAB52279.1 pyridoxal kinase [Lactobacillus johnsonii]